MSSAPVAVTARRSSTSTLLPRFAWGVLAYNVAVILWGAVVRATSSGAGCGDHWPLCNGTVLQSNPRLATLIELAHRMSSGVTLPLVLLLLVWTWRATVAGHLARVAAILAVLFTFNEALLGALLVLLRLTADNRSPARAAYLSLHLANTLLLLGALTLAAHFLSREDGFAWKRVRFTHMGLAITGIAATLAVGVTGTLAALSDTLFPATSLAAAFAQDFSTSGGWLLRLRILHPLSAVVAGIFVCWLLARSFARHSERGMAMLVLSLLVLQFALGIADVTLLAPVWLQIVHLLGADLLWIALVVLTARFCVLTTA
jgi:cytochrome c oxidase assembly protein subunit 15